LDGIHKNSFTYEWRSNKKVINGANKSSFTPTQSEVGRKISLLVRYTDGFGKIETTALSKPTNKVAYMVPIEVDRKTTEFTVCWGETIDEIPIKTLEEFKALAEETLAKSWSKYALVDFVGWKSCDQEK